MEEYLEYTKQQHNDTKKGETAIIILLQQSTAQHNFQRVSQAKVCCIHAITLEPFFLHSVVLKAEAALKSFPTIQGYYQEISEDSVPNTRH